VRARRSLARYLAALGELTVATNGINPGTYELGGGKEASLATGTVTIAEVGKPGEGRLRAKLANVVMEHVTVDPSSGEGNGCVSVLVSVAVDVPIQ
jgi:hypothetical protein